MRQPRPLGTTNLSIQYRNEEDSNKKELLINRMRKILISQYVSNGMEINNRQVTINEYAGFLGISSLELLSTMNKELVKIGKFFDGPDGNQLARATFLKAIFGALETQSLAISQSRILSQEQGQRYVPFLSGELNRAIANQISSFRPITDLLKLLNDNPTTSILIQTNQNTNTNQYITPLEATKLLEGQNHNSLLTNAELIPLKEAELGHLPQVNAKYQNLTSIGIRHSGIEEEEEGTHVDKRDRNKDIEAQ